MARSFIEDVPETRFTQATIRRMYEMVDRAKTDATFQKLVYGVVNRALPGQWKNYRREAEVLLDWVKRTVDYRRDPVNVELVQDVWRTLDIKRADCDDFVVLLGGALETLGVPIRFVTISTKPDRDPSHVYLEAYLEGHWTPMDPIIQWSTVGWEPQDGVTAKQTWTRTDVGLSGYEERPLEGALGMDQEAQSMPDGWTFQQYHANGHARDPWERGFAKAMFSDPRITDDISNTYAPGIPGDIIQGHRVTPSKEVVTPADEDDTPRTQDPSQSYPAMLPIESHLTPTELDYTALRTSVPMVFDPLDQAGAIPTWDADRGYMMPQNVVPEGESMFTDLAGIGDDDIGRAMLADLGSYMGAMTPDERRKLREEYEKCLRDALAKRTATVQDLQRKHDEAVRLFRASRKAIHPHHGAGHVDREKRHQEARALHQQYLAKVKEFRDARQKAQDEYTATLVACEKRFRDAIVAGHQEIERLHRHAQKAIKPVPGERHEDRVRRHRTVRDITAKIERKKREVQTAQQERAKVQVERQRDEQRREHDALRARRLEGLGQTAAVDPTQAIVENLAKQLLSAGAATTVASAANLAYIIYKQREEARAARQAPPPLPAGVTYPAVAPVQSSMDLSRFAIPALVVGGVLLIGGKMGGLFGGRRRR